MNPIEWMFSGIGTLLLKAGMKRAGALFLHKGSDIAPAEAPADAQPEISNEKDVHTESQEMASRFRHVLSSMNKERTFGSYKIASLAKRLDLYSVEELESIFIGTTVADFSFIKKFCEQFGVNADWLAEGKGAPYTRRIVSEQYPDRCFAQIRDSGAVGVCFAKSNAKEGQTVVILKFDNFRYELATRSWHISSHVGGDGRRQLVSFRKLIGRIRKLKKIEVIGREVEAELFTSLLCGNIFPGQVYESAVGASMWWDDFTDIKCTYFTAEEYIDRYGIEFRLAQQLVEAELEYSKSE